MNVLKLSNPVEPSYIKSKMKSAKNVSDYKRWQVLLLVTSYQADATFIAEVTGYSKASIYAIVQQHNNPNEAEVTTKARGGRRRSLMTVEHEKKFMKGLEQKALDGMILSYLDVKKLVEKEIEKTVSDDFIWDLFKRNDWTKHSPRPHHPKRNKELQHEFKKNSKNIWLPQKLISLKS